MPDALSKTIPIWYVPQSYSSELADGRCAVINRAVQRRHRQVPDDKDEEVWNQAYFPPSVVSPSERQQIMDLLPTWTDNLLVRLQTCGADYQASNILLPDLKKPLRPFFIHPSSSQPHIPKCSGYTPIISLSASRWIGITGQQDEVPTVTRVGDRNVGFEYIPGAGDDDELWAKVRFIEIIVL
jgi:tRNA A64-2'-O-ribosylphosphate transferase